MTAHFRYLFNDRNGVSTGSAPQMRTEHDWRRDKLRRQRRSTQALIVIAIIAGAAALHAATRVVAPMLLSVLCALLLAPAVKWLTRIGIPRLCASTMALGVLIVVFGCLLNATWQPARTWLATAPTSMAVIEKKIRPLQSLLQEIDHVGREAQRFAGAPAQSQSAPVSVGLPMAAVTIVPSTVMTLVTSLALVFLLLVLGPLWLERIKESVNASQYRQVVLLIETVRTDLSRYLATIAIIGVVLGTATALLVHAFGVPNALLWGTTAGLFSLIPYVGSLATLVVLTVVGLVSFDSLPPVLGLSGSFLLMQILEGQFIQPFLVGRRLALNPVVVVLAIWFFGALWGVAGVILSVPLLVAMKATAVHIEALHVLLPLIGSISAPTASRSATRATALDSSSWWRRSLLDHEARATDELPS